MHYEYSLTETNFNEINCLHNVHENSKDVVQFSGNCNHVRSFAFPFFNNIYVHSLVIPLGLKHPENANAVLQCNTRGIFEGGSWPSPPFFTFITPYWLSKGPLFLNPGFAPEYFNFSNYIWKKWPYINKKKPAKGQL